MAFSGAGALADSIINWGNNVSTGNIVIDGNVVRGVDKGNYLKGSGKKGQLSRKVPPYDQIEVNSALDVVYRQADSQSLELSGDDNIIPLIQTTVKNGILLLDINKSYSSSMPISVTLQSPSLSRLTVSGSSDVVLRAIDTDKLIITLTGTGDISAEGKVKSLSLDVVGSGDVNFKNLAADRAEVKLSGSGDIQLTSLDELSVVLIGSGDIVYYGGPENINKKIVGSGDFISGD